MHTHADDIAARINARLAHHAQRLADENERLRALNAALLAANAERWIVIESLLKEGRTPCTPS